MAHLFPEKEKMNYFDGDFVEVFRSLLHPLRARQMDANGAYSIPIHHVTDEHLFKHLTGEITLAFDVSTKQKSGRALARFVGIDLDQDFPQRLRIYAAILKQMGLEKSAFATGGSSQSKGKIIICFRERVRKDFAYALAMEIHRCAYEQSFGSIPEKPQKGNVEIFPFNPDNAKDAGVLRILGRHNFRNQTESVEVPLGLDGNPCDLFQVSPVTRSRLASIVRHLDIGESYDDDPPSIVSLIETPWAPGHELVTTKIMRLAHFYATKYDGSAKGDAPYRDRLARIKANSPNLLGPNNPTSSGDRRNPIDEELQTMSAWKKACDRQWVPRLVPERTAGKRAYEHMVKHVKKNGLFPHAFGMTERMLSEEMNCYPNAARKQLHNAQKSGLLLKLHPGQKMTLASSPTGTRKLEHGIPAMYALRGSNETLQDVWEKACDDKHLLERYSASPVGPYSNPNEMHVVPCPLVWKILPELIVRWNGEDLRIAA
jgi:hypothetical protein